MLYLVTFATLLIASSAGPGTTASSSSCASTFSCASSDCTDKTYSYCDKSHCCTEPTTIQPTDPATTTPRPTDPVVTSSCASGHSCGFNGCNTAPYTYCDTKPNCCTEPPTTAVPTCDTDKGKCAVNKDCPSNICIFSTSTQGDCGDCEPVTTTTPTYTDPATTTTDPCHGIDACPNGVGDCKSGYLPVCKTNGAGCDECSYTQTTTTSVTEPTTTGPCECDVRSTKPQCIGIISGECKEDKNKCGYCVYNPTTTASVTDPGTTVSCGDVRDSCNLKETTCTGSAGINTGVCRPDGNGCGYCDYDSTTTETPKTTKDCDTSGGCKDTTTTEYIKTTDDTKKTTLTTRLSSSTDVRTTKTDDTKTTDVKTTDDMKTTDKVTEVSDTTTSDKATTGCGDEGCCGGSPRTDDGDVSTKCQCTDKMNAATASSLSGGNYNWVVQVDPCPEKECVKCNKVVPARNQCCQCPETCDEKSGANIFGIMIGIGFVMGIFGWM